MLSDKDIISLIKQYSETETGKAEIAKRLGGGKFVAEAARKSQKNQSKEQMKIIGEDMKNILFNKISSVISSFKKEDIIVGTPVKQEDNKYMISISFNEDALRRESLDPEIYPEGISNIIKLFITGYTAAGSVHGVWKGHDGEEIWSLRHRDPNDFMEKAVDEFNSKYLDAATAELRNEYKTNI